MMRTPEGFELAAKPRVDLGAHALYDTTSPGHVVRVFRPGAAAGDEDASGDALREFVDTARLQAEVAASCEFWVPFEEHGYLDERVTAFRRMPAYAYTLADVIRAKETVRPANLYDQVRGVVQALDVLRQTAGRPHGNLILPVDRRRSRYGFDLRDLKASNFLFEKKGRDPLGKLLVSDMARPSRIDPTVSPLDDLRAVGLVIQALCGLSPEEDWGGYGSDGNRWKALCVKLLDPSLTPGVYGLPELLADLDALRPPAVAARRVVPAAVGILLVAAVLVAAIGPLRRAFMEVLPIPGPNGGDGGQPAAVLNADQWDDLCDAYNGWFQAFYVKVFEQGSDSEGLRRRWRTDADLARALDSLENNVAGDMIADPREAATGKKGGTFLNLPMPEDLDEKELDRLRTTLEAIRRMESALSSGSWALRRDLGALSDTDYPARGWAGAARSLKAAVEDLEMDSGLAEAITELLEERDRVQVAGRLWQGIEDDAGVIGGTGSAVLGRFKDFAAREAAAAADTEDLVVILSRLRPAEPNEADPDITRTLARFARREWPNTVDRDATLAAETGRSWPDVLTEKTFLTWRSLVVYSETPAQWYERITGIQRVGMSGVLNEAWRTRRDLLLTQAGAPAGLGDNPEAFSALRDRVEAVKGFVAALDDDSVFPASLPPLPEGSVRLVWEDEVRSVLLETRETLLAGLLERVVWGNGVPGTRVEDFKQSRPWSDAAETYAATVRDAVALRQDYPVVDTAIRGWYAADEPLPGSGDVTVRTVVERWADAPFRQRLAAMGARFAALDALARSLVEVMATDDAATLAEWAVAADTEPGRRYAAWRRLGDLPKPWPVTDAEMQTDIAARKALGDPGEFKAPEPRRSELARILVAESKRREVVLKTAVLGSSDAFVPSRFPEWLARVSRGVRYRPAADLEAAVAVLDELGTELLRAVTSEAWTNRLYDEAILNTASRSWVGDGVSESLFRRWLQELPLHLKLAPDPRGTAESWTEFVRSLEQQVTQLRDLNADEPKITDAEFAAWQRDKEAFERNVAGLFVLPGIAKHGEQVKTAALLAGKERDALRGVVDEWYGRFDPQAWVTGLTAKPLPVTDVALAKALTANRDAILAARPVDRMRADRRLFIEAKELVEKTEEFYRAFERELPAPAKPFATLPADWRDKADALAAARRATLLNDLVVAVPVRENVPEKTFAEFSVERGWQAAWDGHAAGLAALEPLLRQAAEVEKALNDFAMPADSLVSDGPAIRETVAAWKESPVASVADVRRLVDPLAGTVSALDRVLRVEDRNELLQTVREPEAGDLRVAYAAWGKLGDPAGTWPDSVAALRTEADLAASLSDRLTRAPLSESRRLGLLSAIRDGSAARWLRCLDRLVTDTDAREAIALLPRFAVADADLSARLGTDTRTGILRVFAEQSPESHRGAAFAAWKRLPESAGSWPSQPAEVEADLKLAATFAGERPADAEGIRAASLSRWVAGLGRLGSADGVASVLDMGDRAGFPLREIAASGRVPGGTIGGAARANVILHCMKRDATAEAFLGRANPDLRTWRDGFVPLLRQLSGDLPDAAAVERFLGRLDRVDLSAESGAGGGGSALDETGPGRRGWALTVWNGAAWVPYDFEEDEPARVRFSKTGFPDLVFGLVRPGGDDADPAYVLLSEVPVGLYLGVVNDAGGWNELRRAYLSDFINDMLDGVDWREGPKTWERDPGGGAFRLRRAEKWVVNTLLEDYYYASADGTHYDPGTPRDEHPVNYVSAPAALWWAALVGCRLPTREEWLAAAQSSTGTENTRDATWKREFDYLTARNPLPNDVRMPFADSHAALDLKTGEDGSAGATDDGVLWFVGVGPTDAGGFRHMGGNVAEYVFDDPSAMDDYTENAADAGLPSADGARKVLLPNLGSLRVAGSSALSPSAGGAANAVSGENVEVGYADVGFRVAFSLPKRTPSERIRRLVAKQAYVVPKPPGG